MNRAVRLHSPGIGRAWSNGYTQLSVYAHELGHNFGLYHAASLYCSGQAIGGSCSSTEYGDPSYRKWE